jgi:hypothetical protein
VVAFLVAFFPIVVNTATGLAGTPAELIDLSRSYRASQLKTFLKVRFPMALPFFFSGLKVAITLAVIGAVVGEFVGSDKGLICHRFRHFLLESKFGFWSHHYPFDSRHRPLRDHRPDREDCLPLVRVGAAALRRREEDADPSPQGIFCPFPTASAPFE